LTGRLDELRRPPADPANIEEVIKVVEQQRTRPREAIVESDPSLVRAVLRDMISKVEIHFKQVPEHSRNRSVFVPGAIHAKTLHGGETSPNLFTAGSRGRGNPRPR
jgi:hypothetical protein